jgi:PAS domain S-box-containing protein
LSETLSVEEALRERMRLAALGAEVGVALTQGESLPDMLRRTAEAVVHHLHAALARVWTLHISENVLELRASAGLYTHLDGLHSRIPVGQLKIGLIAQECQPHLTNAVIGDPRINDQAWAKREGIIAFAGYPLTVGHRLVGVLGMFARQPLTPVTLEALASVANTIALGIERTRAEAVLRSSEQRFRNLVEGSLQGIAIQHHFKALFVNQAYADIFGYTPTDILAMSSTLQLFAPCEHARLQAYHTARLRGENVPSHYECQGVRKDGTPIWVDTLVRLVEWEGHVAGQGTLIDITARKQAEAAQQHLVEQLRQAQKMEAMGTLAGGIAHDFNNILGTILVSTELALKEVPPDSSVRRCMQSVLAAGSRARDLVQQLLAFSHTSDLQLQPVYLHRIVQDALRLLRALLPSTIDLRQHVGTTSSTVLANPMQLHQVLLNLCSNAEHAMRATGGIIEVRLDAVEVTADFAAAHPPLLSGPALRLTVSDTGRGIPPEGLERIFEPFFTTKGVGEGTGLGLAVVHGIVTGHKGTITVTSAPGQGTTFTIYVPRSDASVPSEAPEAPLLQGHEHLLLVDDEAVLVHAWQHILEHLGYTVVACTSSVEALEAFAATPQAFDLVITDQTMPRLTGEALVSEIRRIRPQMPIILCTGFSHTMTAAQTTALGINAFVMKPLAIREFSRVIRQVLEQARREEAL